MTQDQAVEDIVKFMEASKIPQDEQMTLIDHSQALIKAALSVGTCVKTDKEEAQRYAMAIIAVALKRMAVLKGVQ
jgi:putative exporter of polyketide antibiotics